MNACAAGPFPSVAGVLSFSNRYPTQQGDANPSVAGVRGRIGKEMVGIRLSLDPKNPCLVGAGRYDTAACGVRSLGRKLPVSVGGTRRKWKAVGVATDGDPIGNVADCFADDPHETLAVGIDIGRSDGEHRYLPPVGYLDAKTLVGLLDDEVLGQGSEERSVGKECVSRCRSRWLRYH